MEYFGFITWWELNIQHVADFYECGPEGGWSFGGLDVMVATGNHGYWFVSAPAQSSKATQTQEAGWGAAVISMAAEWELQCFKSEAPHSISIYYRFTYLKNGDKTRVVNLVCFMYIILVKCF